MEDTQLRRDFIQPISANINMPRLNLLFLCNPNLTESCIFTGMPTDPTIKSMFILQFSPPTPSPAAHIQLHPWLSGQRHPGLPWNGSCFPKRRCQSSAAPESGQGLHKLPKENKSCQGEARQPDWTLASFVSNKEKGYSQTKLIKIEGNCRTIDNCSKRAVVTWADCHFRGNCAPTANQGH